MQDRDALIFTLATIARRLRLNAVLGEFARMVCAVLGALVLYQILAAAIAAPAVVSALKALLAFLFIGIAGFFSLRGLRPITLEQAASTADAHADLKDELKTGYWFARQAKFSPLIDLQMQRAVLTAQRINQRAVFPVSIPRSALAAVGLAIAAGLLSWFGPHQSPHAQSIAAAEVSRSSAAQKPQAASVPLVAGGQEPMGMPGPTQIARALAMATAGAKLEAAIHGLDQGEEIRDSAGASTRRDAGREAERLEELERRRNLTRASSNGRTIAESVPASPDLLARLRELFGAGGNVPPSALEGGAGDESARAVDPARKADDNMRASGANNPASHTLEEGTNPLQAAIALERFGPREARRSQGQGGEFEGTTDVEGGAMGRRVTQSNLGAGGKPGANEASNSNRIEGEPVLGARTMRLAAQLKRVKIAGNDTHDGGPQAQGIADAAYAATRAQQAQLGYQLASQPARYVTENAVSAERIPVAYRGAVKEYFLDLNRNEK
jgi:hypothetical protein